MLEIPRRDSLDGLRAAADAIATTSALGFARALADGTVSVLYTYAYGVGEWVLAPDLLPDVLLPSSDAFAEMDRPALDARRGTGAVEAFLCDTDTHAVASMRVSGVDPETRLWIGFRDRGALPPDRRRRLDEIVGRAAALLAESPPDGAILQRLERLDQAAELIPALRDVLDVRDVIEKLSATATRALPHDLLILNLFSDDLSTATVYARSRRGMEPGLVIPNRYPASTINAWTFSIVDDHLLHPNERDAPSRDRGRAAVNRARSGRMSRGPPANIAPT